MKDGIAPALVAHGRFEDRQDGLVPTRTTFDARVLVEDDVVRIVNEVPTLDAAVADETVAPVVEDGWYDTFERRVERIDGVTASDDVTVTSVERDETTITVETELVASPGTVADDAIAVISFVEGTWIEGIIPGYDYVDTVAHVRQRARQNAQESPEA